MSKTKIKIEKLAEYCKTSKKKFLLATLDYSGENGGTLTIDSDVTSKDLGIIINALCGNDKTSLIALGVTVGQLIQNLKSEQIRPIKNSNK